MSFGQRLRERREELGMTRGELAKALGVSQSAISNYESGLNAMREEVLLRLLLYQPEFKNAEHEKAWMIRTAMNLSKDLLKSKWHTSTVGMEAMPKTGEPYLQGVGLEIDDTLEAVLELSERYRDCLYLFYYEDYSIREIARILEVPQNTVKTNLKRGREALRQKLLERR